MRYLGRNWTDADFEGLRAIVVPSGIGELQWACAKYINTGERFAFLGLDGAPRRLHQFAELLPFCDVFAYCTFDYSQIRQWQEFHGLTTWAAVKNKFELGSKTMLACNPHLEAGRPLAEWLPDLDTTYRFALNTTQDHNVKASLAIANAEHDDVLIGISCASYRGADAWRTWHASEWVECLSALQSEIPTLRFVLMGGAWDDLTASVFDEAPHLRWATDARGNPPVGRTSFGTAVELLRRMSGYIGFSSGLGHVAAHCCGTPVFMLWPDHEQPLSYSWVDPELLDNGAYVPSPWLPPDTVLKRIRPWLRRIYDGSYCQLARVCDDGGSGRSHG